MDLQAHLPPALMAIHKFICDHDPIDLNNLTEVEDMEPGWHSGHLADELPCHAERRAKDRHNDIADAMWVQYQQHLAAKGDDDEAWFHL